MLPTTALSYRPERPQSLQSPSGRSSLLRTDPEGPRVTGLWAHHPPPRCRRVQGPLAVPALPIPHRQGQKLPAEVSNYPPPGCEGGLVLRDLPSARRRRNPATNAAAFAGLALARRAAGRDAPAQGVQWLICDAWE